MVVINSDTRSGSTWYSTVTRTGPPSASASTLVITEQFGTLETLHPGPLTMKADLGRGTLSRHIGSLFSRTGVPAQHRERLLRNPAKVKKEGAGTVPAKKLLDCVRLLPDT